MCVLVAHKVIQLSPDEIGVLCSPPSMYACLAMRHSNGHRGRYVPRAAILKSISLITTRARWASLPALGISSKHLPLVLRGGTGQGLRKHVLESSYPPFIPNLLKLHNLILSQLLFL